MVSQLRGEIPRARAAFGHDLELCLLIINERIRRHAVDQEHVPADRAARADDSFAPEDGRVRIDGHVVFQSRMTFPAFFDLATLVLEEAARP